MFNDNKLSDENIYNTSIFNIYKESFQQLERECLPRRMSKEPSKSNMKKELTQTTNKSLKMFNHRGN